MQMMYYIIGQEESMLNFFYKEKENMTMIRQQAKISGTGKWAENQVIKDANGWQTEDASKGDLYVPVNGGSGGRQADVAAVEVKSQGSNQVDHESAGYTCNQVRPISFTTLVVCVSNMTRFDCDYLVFPAMEIMRRKLGHAGQHTKDAMICTNMRVSTRDAKMYGCGRHDLQNRIEEAYNFSENHEAAELTKYQIAARLRDCERRQEDNQTLADLLNGIEG